MSTLRVNTIQNAAGNGPPAAVNAAKAWVNFNGTGTVAIRESFNVSSITDYGVGYYGVNFSSAFSDANYTVVTGVRTTTTSQNRCVFSNGDNVAHTSALFAFFTSTLAGSPADSEHVYLAFFKN